LGSITLLAVHKLNIFHWHLTDDQGWRIEIKKFPKLTEIGAWRVDRRHESWNTPSDQREPVDTKKPLYGGFYTQEDIREIVAYAKARYITVVPEIDMPGHVVAALAAYPELSCKSKPIAVKSGSYWPITDVLCPGKEETFKFIEQVLSEAVELFPGKYFHIGGDEVNKTNWQVCSHCQARMKAEGLKDVNELQSYFVKRVEKILKAKNKRLIGWDEILEGGLAPDATVMSWRGEQGGITAAQQEHDVIMTPTMKLYFNRYQDDPNWEQQAYRRVINLKDVYLYDPVPDSLNSEQAKHVLGAQGCLWGEYVQTPDQAQIQILPRLCALSEIVWTPAKKRDWENFHKRLEAHYPRLDQWGMKYYIPIPTGFERETVFLDDIEIDLHTDIRNAEIRYTLDGSEPSAQSLLCTRPIRIDKSSILTACTVLPSGKVSRSRKGRFVKGVLRPPEVLQPDLQTGLSFAYFEGKIKSLDDFKFLNKIDTGIIERFILPENHAPDYFGLEFTGYIKIPSDGIYTFYTSSDDGSRLFIGDSLLIDNDGIQAETERSRQIALAAGYHSIRVLYFDFNYGETLKVFYKGPGIDKQEIPESKFFHLKND